MRFRILPIATLLALLLAAPALAAPPAKPGAQERCPVCGMFVAKYDTWAASIVFKDGTVFHFDGPKDLFRCFFELGRYRPGATAADVAAVYVTEYYGTEAVDARQVFFVTDSDVLGPMGKELVPVRGREAAETFRRDHGGKRILVFDGAALNELPPAP
jgi:nitrous oxide reductase accessory protein NosL